MTEDDPKALEVENLEVTELDDQDLEDASGGGPVTQNGNCPCNPSG